ncbi:PREDICTED: PRAME family member 12-like [Elephantulus edwardii]|uniref:PRAME family member 12-like n=1 Tax=Elephantulus edwardii TaxID=28737 RepID=UPI0003F0814A|nr:PREDICTED: PRAME family member 12-like [Elephantulus edwardii]
MSSSSPPSLFDLAKQSLMKDEVWAKHALQSVPLSLIRPLIREVGSSRNSMGLNAVMWAWPVLRPPLRTWKLEFMRNPTTYAVLEKILQNVHLDHLQELEFNHSLKLQDLHSVFPILGQMVHLNTFQLCPVIGHPCVTQAKQEMDNAYPRRMSQFLHLHQFKHIFLSSVFYLEGHMGQILRYLETPLLSWCPCTSRLKCLYLNYVILIDFNSELLRVLLERVSATLEYLDLDGCSISDSQLTALLPSLSFCSQLQYLDFCGLENLLRQTLPPNQTRYLLLPLLLECYRGLYCGVHRRSL